MNGRELLVGLGYISEELYEEAGVTTVTPAARRKALSRPVLIAALIALTALMVGCSVLYVLRLQVLTMGFALQTGLQWSPWLLRTVPLRYNPDQLTAPFHSYGNSLLIQIGMQL